MEHLISKKEILTVWHAFSREDSAEGWRSIRLGDTGKIAIIAGCRFPEKEEYIAFGFRNFTFPGSYKFPQCKGFHVLQNDNIIGNSNSCWLVILKNQQAGIDLFVTMVEDLLKTLLRTFSGTEQYIFRTIISRIVLWQRFLSKSAIPVLSSEKELGLLGELHYLKSLLSYLDHENALEYWKGPLDESKDFILGNGGVEVKSSVSTRQFKAKISSLEQLDTTTINPLFFIGYRFEINDKGETLVSTINSIREILGHDKELVERFESLLMNYGYIDMYSSVYTRVFLFTERLVFKVVDNFPRITEENVMSGIQNAKYEIDISNLPQEYIDDRQMLNQLGVIK
jgi:hypothetical protein